MADNLEDLNRQLEEAQKKVVDAEKQYSSTRDELSKIGDAYYKTTMLTVKEQENVTKKYKDLRETLNKEIEHRKVLNKALDEETKVEKKKIEKAKQEVSEIQKKIEEAKKPNFLQRMGFKESSSKDDLATQYRARQMAGGLESILEGRVASGFRQLGSTVPIIANFMSGPLYAAMSGLASATIKAVDSFTKFSAVSARLSGSETGAKITDRYRRLSDTSSLAMMYGQNVEDFDKYLMTNIGALGRKSLWTDRHFSNTLLSTRADFERMGVDPNRANSLINQQLSIGRSSDDMRKFNYQLRETTKTMDKFSSEKFISAYEELNKTFIANNINGMANARTLARFQDQLNKGTLSISDFTKSLTSRRTSETSTLAGVGAMLAERGLGGKDLQDAYRRGDMIAVAGIVRRGGQNISRDIEKISPEIAKEFGTSDIMEALALQSGTPWGQLSPNLKNIEVQKILASGGSLAIGAEGKPSVIKPEDIDSMEKSEKELIDETVQLTGTFKLLREYIKLNILQQGVEMEEKGFLPYINKAAQNLFVPGLGTTLEAVFKIGNPSQTPR